jgi:hypothetical protein
LAAAGLADAVLKHERGTSGDEPFYTLMASHPGATHSFPYAFRIGVPWLVHVLPFSQTVAFQVQALALTAASGAALYALMRHFDVSARLAAPLAVGFVVSPTLLVALLRHGRSIDPASALVMTLGCLFIVRRQRLALAATLLIGVTVKETSLFLIPLAYAVWAERILDRRAMLDVVLAAIVPIAGYAVLRLAIPATGSSYTPDHAGSFLHVRLQILRQTFSGTDLRRMAYTYGPLWVLAPLALRRFSIARRGLVLVAICALAMTVSWDGQRVIFIAAPIFYLAAALVLKGRPRWALATVIALFAVDIGYAGYMQVHGVQHGLDNTAPSAIPVH